MDKVRLSDMLGVPAGGTFWVRDLHHFDWGAELVLDCTYEIGQPSTVTAFQIILKDCRDLHWRVYAHLKPLDDQTLPAAAVVNLRLGTNDHRRPLHLLTDSFGLTVSYGTLALVKSGLAG